MAGARDPRVAAVEVEDALSLLTSRLGRPNLRSGAASIADLADRELHELEASAVAYASAARRAEFAAGRALLRRLLGDTLVVPAAADRRPLLPEGFSASLAHDAELVVAVAAMGRVALGIDVERSGAVDAETARVVARPDEAGLDPTLLFCAKEAVYKAWSAAGGGFLEHHDVRVRFDGAMLSADIERSPWPPALVIGEAAEVVGAWATAGGRLVVVVAADLTPAVAAVQEP